MEETTPAGTLRRYGAFFLLALALDLAPGPDILFVLAQSLAHGRDAGVYVTLGLCTGICMHVALAAFGVAAFLARFPRAFAAVTLCGAAYLAYLGVEAWRSAAVVTIGGSAAPALPPLRLYLRGVVMNVCNPKVMLFFLSLVPRFTRPGKGGVALQFMLLGLLFILSTLLSFTAVACGGGVLAGFLARWPSAPRVLQYFAALVLFGLAAWIAWPRTAKSD